MKADTKTQRVIIVEMSEEEAKALRLSIGNTSPSRRAELFQNQNYLNSENKQYCVFSRLFKALDVVSGEGSD